MKNIRQYIWGALGRFAPSLIFLVTNMVLARFLTPDDFGIIGVLAIIFTVADAMTDAGLGGSLIKEPKLSGVDCSTIFNFNLGVSAVLYLIIFLSSDYIERYFAIPGLGSVTRWLSLTFVINAFSLVPKSLLMRDVHFKSLFQISVVSNVIAAILSVAAAIMGAKVYAIVIYRLAVSLCGSLLTYIYSKFQYSFVFSTDSFKRLIPFGLFTSLSAVIDTIYENILTTIFGKVMGVTTAGYFYQAKKTEESATSSLSNTVGYVAFPILSKEKGDKARFVSESLSIMNTIVGTIVPVVLMVSVYSEEIIRLLYGSQWNESAGYFRLLMYAGCFMIMESLNRSFIKSLGEGKVIFSVSLVKRGLGLLVLFVVAVAAPKLMVLAYILCTVLAFLINQYAYSRCININFLMSLAPLLKTIIPSLLLVLCFISVDSFFEIIWIELLIDISILASYYFLYLPKVGVNVVVDAAKSLLGKTSI